MKPTHAIAHSGHSHQRNSSPPSPAPEISPANQNEKRMKPSDRSEREQSIPRENEALSSPASAIDTRALEGKIVESNSTRDFVPLIGEGIFFLLLIAPIALIFLKQQYHRSHRKI